MFKKLSFGVAVAALSLGAASFANAADVEPGPTCGNWSGFYAGAHAGYLWGNGKGDSDDVAALDADIDLDGFNGGALLGANFQTDCIVFGVEGDIGFGDMKGSDNDVGLGDVDADAKIKWNGHVRARLGYSAGEVMPFIAGGLAIADVDVDSNLGDDTNTHYGWTLGGGIDWAVSEQFVVRAEYLYDDYSKKSYDIDNTDIDGKLDSHTVRAALIWNFGGL